MSIACRCHLPMGINCVVRRSLTVSRKLVQLWVENRRSGGGCGAPLLDPGADVMAQLGPQSCSHLTPVFQDLVE